MSLKVRTIHADLPVAEEEIVMTYLFVGYVKR